MKNYIESPIKALIDTTDILILLETWNLTRYVNYNKDFLLVESMATCFQGGRPSGGIVLLYDKHYEPQIRSIYKDHQSVIVEFDNLLDNGLNLILIALYWKPEGNILEQIDSLEEQLASYAQNDIFVIMGDLNARMGGLQEIDYNDTSSIVPRKSMDDFVNARGKELREYIKNRKFIVLNGRIGDDNLGRYTFCNYNGQSLIDLAMISSGHYELANNLSVEDFLASDHMALKLYIKPKNITDNYITSYVKKYNWSGNNIELYRTELNNRLRNLDFSDADIGATEITEIILLTLRDLNIVSQITTNKNTYKSKGFDKECKIEKKKLNKLRKKYLKDPLCNRSEYLIKRKAYKNILKIKKREYWEGKIEILAVTRDSKTFWNNINQIKIKKCFRLIKINEPNKWIDYYSKHLESKNAMSSFVTTEREDIYIDAEIDILEVKIAIEGMKKGKAPGMDELLITVYKNMTWNRCKCCAICSIVYGRNLLSRKLFLK